MPKTIFITGATDGIGLATARVLHAKGHKLLVHGRNKSKLETLAQELDGVETYQADLSSFEQIKHLAEEVLNAHAKIDVLINNAGVYKTQDVLNKDGFDIRFVVNTIAPYILLQKLKPLLGQDSRVVNLSSAAQAPVSIEAMQGKKALGDSEAYAQSKLALTMWTNHEASTFIGSMFSVNPASFLGSKMVKEAYGVAGKDLSIGADILTRAALDDTFAKASAKYYDNDIGAFSMPHPDALDSTKCEAVVEVIETILEG